MIEAIIVTSLFVWGFHSVTRDGMLLGFVERFWQWENPEYKKFIEGYTTKYALANSVTHPKYYQVEDYVKSLSLAMPPETYTPKIAYPLSECPVCMASIWGTASWWLLYAPNYSVHSFALWPVFCIATAGLCALLGYFND